MILKRTASLVLASGLLATMAAPAFAQGSEHREMLEFQLEMARSFADLEGLTIAAGPFFGSIDTGGTETFLLPVNRGVDYTLVGVCDGDCDDLDIRVYNSSGALIAEDVLEDSLPTVTLTPSINGEVSVEVQMISCSAEPCFYAVEGYRPN